MNKGSRQRDELLHDLLVALSQPLEGVSGSWLERVRDRALHPAAVGGRAVTQQVSGFRGCFGDGGAARVQVGQPACRGLPQPHVSDLIQLYTRHLFQDQPIALGKVVDKRRVADSGSQTQTLQDGAVGFDFSPRVVQEDRFHRA